MHLASTGLLLLSITLCAACGDKSDAVADAAPTPPVADARVDPCTAVDARTSCEGVSGCDYFLHCGCGATDKCTVATTGPGCAPAGQAPAGSACTVDTDCARGTICVPFF